MKGTHAWGAAAAFVVVLGAGAACPLVARADAGGNVAADYGFTHVGSSVEDDWRPMLRFEGAYSPAPFFHLGAFVQLTGRDAFLTDAHGGGGLVARFLLKLPLVPVAPFLDATVGRLRMPNGNDGVAGLWMTSVGGGLAFYFADFIGLRMAVEHQWLYGVVQSDAMDDRTWTGRVGLFISFREHQRTKQHQSSSSDDE